MDQGPYNKAGYDRYGRAKPAPFKPLKSEKWYVKYPKLSFYVYVIPPLLIWFSGPIYEMYLYATGQIPSVEEQLEKAKIRRINNR